VSAVSTAKANLRRPIFGRVYPKMAAAMDDGGMTERRQALLAGLTGEVARGLGRGRVLSPASAMPARLVAERIGTARALRPRTYRPIPPTTVPLFLKPRYGCHTAIGGYR
jgi:hypothetical protein